MFLFLQRSPAGWNGCGLERRWRHCGRLLPQKGNTLPPWWFNPCLRSHKYNSPLILDPSSRKPEWRPTNVRVSSILHQRWHHQVGFETFHKVFRAVTGKRWMIDFPAAPQGRPRERQNPPRHCPEWPFYQRWTLHLQQHHRPSGRRWRSSLYSKVHIHTFAYCLNLIKHVLDRMCGAGAVWRGGDICEWKESDWPHRSALRYIRWPCLIFHDEKKKKQETFKVSSDLWAVMCTFQETVSSWGKAMCSALTTRSRLAWSERRRHVLRRRQNLWTGPSLRGSCWRNKASTWSRRWSRGVWNHSFHIHLPSSLC